jgi:4-carboxymuconolactone decarboxylase
MSDITGIRVPLIAPGTRPDLAEIEQSIMAQRGRISVLYQVLLNSAPIAHGWEKMLTAVRNQTGIAADLRELMILRVAVLNRASFEFEAHVPHAQRAGVSPEKIDAVKDKACFDAIAETGSLLFTPVEQALLRLTDAMTLNVDVPDNVMQDVQARFDAKTTVELVATVAAYNMVSRLLVALRITH